MKSLVFDMDGTFVNLYGVDGWLEMLINEDSTPYTVAEPLYDMDTFNTLVGILQDEGWHIVITSWLSKDSSEEYAEAVKVAKMDWLRKYNVPFNEIHLIPYGTDKGSCTENLGGFQILFDDNDDIRNLWTLGLAIDAKQNLLEKLADIIIG